MGGKQYKPQSTQRYKPKEVKRYKRFCSKCRRVTYDWKCCGQRTRRLNMQSTIGNQITVNPKVAQEKTT